MNTPTTQEKIMGWNTLDDMDLPSPTFLPKVVSL